MHHMFHAIRRILDEQHNVKALYPIHMNLVVRQAANEKLGDCDRVHIIDSVEVFDCHNIMARSYIILTDSGGIQEGSTIARKAGTCVIQRSALRELKRVH